MNPQKCRRRRDGPVPVPDSKEITTTSRRIITPQPQPPRYVKTELKNVNSVPKSRREVSINAGASFSDWIVPMWVSVFRAAPMLYMAALFLYALWSNWLGSESRWGNTMGLWKSII